MTSCLFNCHEFTCAHLRFAICGVITYFRLQLQDTLGCDQSTLSSSLETRVGAKRSPIRNSLSLTIRKMPRIRYCGLAGVDSEGGLCYSLPPSLSAPLTSNVLGSAHAEPKQAMITRALDRGAAAQAHNLKSRSQLSTPFSCAF